MKPITGATPLIALPAVAIDTETTGLDAEKARIVQMAGIRIEAGKVIAASGLELLIDPGESIPAAASRIHGIGDADVAGEAGFAASWPRLLEFAGDRVLIGHSVGFDLAVFERECRRANLAWQKPRALCVRLLGAAAKPDLPDHSLETLAAWLGIELVGRHSALGDARAAAEIFVALAPRLLDRGIRTLAEAERASLGLAGELERGYRAGWSEPVSMPNAPAFYSVDPYAYRRRIGDLMSRPPVVVKADTPARRAVEIMVERRISSVLVSEDGADGGPISQYGIVTERDIMRRLASERGEFLGRPVDSFASRPLASVSASAFAYRAISRMDRLQIRHLAVRSDEGMLAGIVSARDLLKLRASAAINLDDAIEHSESAAEMAAAWAALPGVARALLAEGIEARTVAEIVSEEACAMTRRAAVLAERTMEAAGRGGPPCAYAMLVLGSAGRGESLLAADQDNAIVFAEGDPDGEEDRWFAEFGETLNATLDAAGIPYCSGGVMAKNAGFRGSFATWQARIEDWVRRSRPEDLLNVDITFDLRPVHGELAMAGRLFDLAYERGRDEPAFAKLLGARLTEGNPFTIFGRFALDRGRLDLKLHGLFPIVAAARALAIRHGIAKRSTRERLDALIAMDLGGDMDMQAMLASHEILLGLLLAQQIRDLYAGTPLSNRVEIAALSPPQQAELKTILKQLQTVPTLVHDLMFA